MRYLTSIMAVAIIGAFAVTAEAQPNPMAMGATWMQVKGGQPRGELHSPRLIRRPGMRSQQRLTPKQLALCKNKQRLSTTAKRITPNEAAAKAGQQSNTKAKSRKGLRGFFTAKKHRKAKTKTKTEDEDVVLTRETETFAQFILRTTPVPSPSLMAKLQSQLQPQHSDVQPAAGKAPIVEPAQQPAPADEE